MTYTKKNEKEMKKEPFRASNGVHEGDQFILDIKRMGINGEGIGFYNRLAIFVDGVIPGEGHQIEITKVEGKMAYGKSIECKHASEARKAPECPYYEECGGCSVMHIDYQEMLKLKRELLIEALNRYTTINTRQFEIKPTIGSELEFGYRNKSSLNVKRTEDKLGVAMIKAKSNILVPVTECKIQSPVLNDLNTRILAIADELGIDPYVQKFSRGVLRYLVIRTNKEGKALVCFVCSEKNEKVKALAEKILEFPEVSSVYENINSSLKTPDIFGPVTNHLGGTKYIVEKLGRIKYQIYPTTFFQLNSYQAEKMYDTVLKAAKLSFKERVLDAYCGVGTIGLYLAHNSKEVVGIEYNKESVMAANQNAKFNNISNAKFLQGDAAELLPKMVADGETFDVIVADPPRTGLGDKFMNAILETEVKKIIYVSCNPATLAKNLEVLKQKYVVKSITPIDMFPQTALVESVVTLSLREQKN